jgi:Flp pilus assembly protein TadG
MRTLSQTLSALARAFRSDRRLQGEGGAITAIVAMVMAMGVLLGMSAFVVDAGRSHLERRVVQSAADTAAMAVAQDCAERQASCANAAAAATDATTIANLNSPDAATDVTAVCGKAPLAPCGQPSARVLDCKPVDAKYGTSYARVHTATRTSDGGTALQPVFARLTEGGAPAQTLTACAQAAWGKAAAVNVQYPFALPICQYDLSGTPVLRDFASNDPLESCTIQTLEGARSYSQVIKGFSYVRLPAADGMCASAVPVRVGDILEREPSTAQLCGSDLVGKLSRLIGVPTWMPVVTTLWCNGGTDLALCKTGQGSFRYQVASFVKFSLVGFKLQSREGGTPPAGGWRASNCTSSGACLYGSYSLGTAPDADISFDPSVPSLGLMALQPLP